MSAPTLYSVVLNLTPVAAATVEKAAGQQMHAPFLAAVRTADPELAHAFRAARRGIRPFTLSPLRGVAAHDGALMLRPGQDCWMRLTLLESALYAQLADRFGSGAPRPAVRLDHAELRVHELLTVPGAHPGAGHVTWRELAERASTATEITLRFKSPTAFSFGDRHAGKRIVLLPDTALVFDSLARAWNEYAPEHLRVDRRALRTFAAEHIVGRQFGQLDTHLLYPNRAYQVGFVGEVRFTLVDASEDERRRCNMLADFAFYAGVGMKTAMGMGQCCRK